MSISGRRLEDPGGAGAWITRSWLAHPEGDGIHHHADAAWPKRPRSMRARSSRTQQPGGRRAGRGSRPSSRRTSPAGEGEVAGVQLPLPTLPRHLGRRRGEEGGEIRPTSASTSSSLACGRSFLPQGYSVRPHEIRSRARSRALESLDRTRDIDVGHVAIDTETNSLDPMQAMLCGFSLAVTPNEAC